MNSSKSPGKPAFANAIQRRISRWLSEALIRGMIRHVRGAPGGRAVTGAYESVSDAEGNRVRTDHGRAPVADGGRAARPEGAVVLTPHARGGESDRVGVAARQALVARMTV